MEDGRDYRIRGSKGGDLVGSFAGPHIAGTKNDVGCLRACLEV
jgi:hypothetical protein